MEEFLEEEETERVFEAPLISPFNKPYEEGELERLLNEDDGPEKAPIMDVKQKTCWDFYVNPKSPTFGNGKGSAIRAGYSESYSHNIGNQPFFKDKLRRLNMLPRAEKVLKKALIMDTKDINGREQADLLRIQVDAAKHITKTLGKDEGYSERSEVTGKDGSPIVFLPAELMEKYAIPADAEEINKTNQE